MKEQPCQIKLKNPVSWVHFGFGNMYVIGDLDKGYLSGVMGQMKIRAELKRKGELK